MRKILALLILSLALPVILTGCATTYSGKQLLKLPSGKPVSNKGYYSLLNEKKSVLQKDKVKLEQSLINMPNVPIYIHSVILRALIMPYVDRKNILHTYQYVYFTVKKGGWLIGNYLTKSGVHSVFNPLGRIKSNSSASGAIFNAGTVKSNAVNKRNSSSTLKSAKGKGSFYNSVYQNDINAAKQENK
jgi:hypothetical protein